MAVRGVADPGTENILVTSVTGTANQITVSPTTGAAVVSLATNVTTPGNLTIKSGSAFTLGNAATTGLIAGALAALTTASIVITDSTGQAYRVPCVV